jgi:hypothetical protein
MNKLPNHTSLKEWAAVVSALRNGDQIILVRKGGIADPSFGVEAERFYLLPTYMHQKEKQFRPGMRHHFAATDRPGGEPEAVEVDTWCEVARVWRVADRDLLRRLEPFVIFTAETFEERYRFRPDQAVHVIAVRAHKLPAPVSVRNAPEYAGCKSWVSVAEEIDVTGSMPALGDEAFMARLAEIDAVITRDRAETSTS